MSTPSRFLRPPRSGLLALTLAVAAVVLAPAAASADPISDVALQSMTDGTTPFDASGGPGRDENASNGQVRSYDTVTFAWTVNVNSTTGASESFDRVEFTQTLPDGLSWVAANVPLYCQGPGWDIAGQTLTCIYVPAGGTGSTGTTLNFTLSAQADGEPDGTVATSAAGSTSVTVSSGATTSSAATATAPPVTIRSAPFLDMYKRSPAGSVAPGGYYVDYTVGLQVAQRTSTLERRGFLMPNAPVTFTDDLSGISPNAQFVSCSGALTCTPAGQSVGIAITSLPADPQPNRQIASGTLRVFVPQADVDADPDGNLTTVNALTGLVAEAPAVGGGTVPAEGDDPANNTVGYNLVTQGGSGNASFNKRFLAADGSLLPTQLTVNDGNGQVRNHQVLVSELRITNASNTAGVPTPAICDVWDNTRIHLSDAGPGPAAHGGAPVWLQSGNLAASDYVIEYGTQATATGDDATRWGELRARTACDDASDTWTTTPPADLSTVTKVRIRLTGDLPPGIATHVFRVNLQVDDAATGDFVANFAGRRVGSTWTASTYNPATNAGFGTGDRVRTNGVTVRVRKRASNPSVGFGTQATILSGSPIQFELTPRVTALDIGTGPAQATNVVLRDRLPAGLTFDTTRPTTPDSLTPIVTSDASGRQILTWTIPQMTAGSEPTITFWAQSATTAVGTRTNEVVIASDDDLGSLTAFPTSTIPATEQHYASQEVRLQSAGGVRISKAALQTVVEPVDELAFRIEYANLTATPASNVDIIDVLPFDGDGSTIGAVVGRNPATDPHGTLPLAGIDVANGETIRYTDADPEVVYASSNPATTNDAAYGALPAGKTWCPEADFGNPGCPASLADVTAVRIGRASLPSGDSATITLRLAPVGNRSGDVYSNTAAIRYGSGNLGALSNVASSRVVASSIGDYVWSDLNRNGIQDADEPGLANVLVTLTGTDKHGRAISVRTRTDADGKYLLTSSSQTGQDAGAVDLVSGTYTVTFHRDGLPPGTTFTTRNAPGSTAADGSDADPATGTASFTLPNPAPTGADGEDLDLDAGIVLGRPVPPSPTRTPEPPGEPPAPGGGERPATDGPSPTGTGGKGNQAGDGASASGSGARLTIAKRASQRTVMAGRSVRFTIVVRNRGAEAARGTVVCDAPGAGLTVTSVPRGARLREGRLCWRLGTLRPGAQRVVRVTMRTLRSVPARRVSNVARITAAQARSARASVSVRVRPNPAMGDRPAGVTG